MSAQQIKLNINDLVNRIEDEDKLQACYSVLQYETMSEDEKKAYSRRIENRRIENSVIDTAIGKTAWLKSIEIAKKALVEGANIDFIVTITGLLKHEVILLSEGKELDADTDD
jgi:Txe/YoeB family toxin of Txe-Axe toxin-antitoxin module